MTFDVVLAYELAVACGDWEQAEFYLQLLEGKV